MKFFTHFFFSSGKSPSLRRDDGEGKEGGGKGRKSNRFPEECCQEQEQ